MSPAKPGVESQLVRTFEERQEASALRRETELRVRALELALERLAGATAEGQQVTALADVFFSWLIAKL